MPKTDIKLYSTDAATGSKITTSVPYVNPNASNDALKEFALKLNAFTTNTYASTDRVETVNVDTESGRKQFRNITVTGAIQGATATISANIQIGGSINPAVFFFTNNTVTILTTAAVPSDDPTIAKRSVTIPNSSGEMYIGLIANDDFYADFTFVSIT